MRYSAVIAVLILGACAKAPVPVVPVATPTPLPTPSAPAWHITIALPTPTAFRLVVTGEPDQRAIVQRAADRWNDALATPVFGATGVVVPVEWVEQMPSAPAGRMLGVTSTPSGGTPLVALWNAMAAYELPAPVVLHELGHVLGLVHSDDPGDVMHDPIASGVRDLSPGDIRRARLALHLN